ncbi:MAG: hypothetical protein IJR43_10605 [Synergistaceae bacterium]|nr:hypothetical protein [Synergistaceae bacterium]MBQ3694742.1 hypothetical protein [Synergistaceae bacterium]MBQ9629692.1 hypothetical protein [Synergistaceae bacterium]MBR0250910.1 hypothetical protein [Synergistaceae bacterium]
MLNDNSLKCVYSHFNSRNTAPFVLCLFVSSASLMQVDISCVKDIAEIDCKQEVTNNIENLQLTFESGESRNGDSSCVNLDLQFTQAMQINLDKLKEIALFQENWNGYGAKPLSESVIKRAEDVIRGVYIQPRLFPTADNTIQMEYEKPTGAYLEIQITSDDAYEMFFMPDKDSEGEESFIEAKVENVNKEIEKFYAS